MSDVKQVGLTKRILEILKKEPRQTPQSLLGKLDVSMSAIRNNLMVLSDLNLVEAETRGLYKITLLGEHVLENVKRGDIANKQKNKRKRKKPNDFPNLIELHTLQMYREALRLDKERGKTKRIYEV